MVFQELGEPDCGERMFGGDIYGWAREAMGRRKLAREKEGKEELGLAGAAENERQKVSV